MATPTWLDEIELDPTASPVALGIRALGRRPWLIVDDQFESELALKRELSRTRFAEVFAAEAGAEAASERVIELLVDAGVEIDRDLDGLHPLDAAGRSVQEDLCIMRKDPDGWHLAAASLCFPSRWRLADKMGRHITEVHAPVVGYADRLASRVDGFFDRMTDRPVWRRNWFVHPDPALFQPDPPEGGDPIIGSRTALSELFLRSERQTLRELAPLDGWILFTIRVQQAPLAALAADGDRLDAFGTYLADAPAEVLAHRGMRPPQVVEIQAALRGL